MMLLNLLFATASFVGGDPVPPPPPPVPISHATVSPASDLWDYSPQRGCFAVAVEPGVTKSELEAELGFDCPTFTGTHDGVPIPPNPPVEIWTGDGWAVTGQAEVDAMAALPPETEEEYLARLSRQLCEVKPSFCPA